MTVNFVALWTPALAAIGGGLKAGFAMYTPSAEPRSTRIWRSVRKYARDLSRNNLYKFHVDGRMV